MQNEKIEVVLPPNTLTSLAPAVGTPQAPYEPTITQMIFGNAHGEFDLGVNERYVAEKLYELSEMLGKKSPDAQVHGLLGGEWGYGQDFKNDVLEMHPYWWGGCTCGFDEKDSSWSEEHPHTEICFFNRYQAEEEPLINEGIPFAKRNDLMIKWAKANGYVNAPNGMAVHCDCGVDQAYVIWRNSNNHASDCRKVVPNFKCDGLEIRWYKYIGRGMSMNREVSREELRRVFRKCRQSIK